ncbi:MAG: manganese efflux pump [Glaciecola sp.]|jgi:putative Mn2+ efflux pump MntP
MSVDAFLVSLSLSASKSNRKTAQLALMATAYFGVFHAAMPYIGNWGGLHLFGWLEQTAKYIAFVLLVLVAVKMLHEGLSDTASNIPKAISHTTMLLLSFATSVDAIAIGFSLPHLTLQPYIACLVIGLSAGLLSASGVYLGKLVNISVGKSSSKYMNSIGALLLLLIAIKLVISS